MFIDSNYNFKKAIFELIVVFLGVTAGFLLNNWQMDNKDSELEKKYIAGFYNDITSNIEELEGTVNQDSVWLKIVMPNVIAIQQNSISVDSANSVIKRVLNVSKISLNKGTYEDIINSGNLNLIADYELKSAIVDYYLAVEGIKFLEDYFYQYFSDFIMPFTFNNYDILKGDFIDNKIVKNSKFANLIAGYFSMVQQRFAAHKDILIKSIDLQKKLEKYNSH